MMNGSKMTLDDFVRILEKFIDCSFCRKLGIFEDCQNTDLSCSEYLKRCFKKILESELQTHGEAQSFVSAGKLEKLVLENKKLKRYEDVIKAMKAEGFDSAMSFKRHMAEFEALKANCSDCKNAGRRCSK